jgi:prophage maintenance system killer protein
MEHNESMSEERFNDASRTGGEIVIYQSAEGTPGLEVKLEKDTVWLSQRQMGALFEKDTDTIGLHIRNIFKDGELEEGPTTEESSVVQKEGDREIRRKVRFYNLDVIISVGYRVKSARGTQFRIWATGILRDHLLKGYTVNENRLKELNKAIRLIADIAGRRPLTGDEATGLLRVVADYSYALDLLDDYDHERIRTGDTTVRTVSAVGYEEAIYLIERLRRRFGAGEIFGLEKDDSLKGSLATIMQTFDGRELYPSIEEKAAHLLYFLVKNHSFADGNKRIAAALFLWFLEKNKALYNPDGSKRIADNALVAMTLLIAESNPEEKDVLARVVVNLINRRNQ